MRISMSSCLCQDLWKCLLVLFMHVFTALWFLLVSMWKSSHVLLLDIFFFVSTQVFTRWFYCSIFSFYFTLGGTYLSAYFSTFPSFLCHSRFGAHEFSTRFTDTLADGPHSAVILNGFIQKCRVHFQITDPLTVITMCYG